MVHRPLSWGRGLTERRGSGATRGSRTPRSGSASPSSPRWPRGSGGWGSVYPRAVPDRRTVDPLAVRRGVRTQARASTRDGRARRRGGCGHRPRSDVPVNLTRDAADPSMSRPAFPRGRRGRLPSGAAVRSMRAYARASLPVRAGLLRAAVVDRRAATGLPWVGPTVAHVVHLTRADAPSAPLATRPDRPPSEAPRGISEQPLSTWQLGFFSQSLLVASYSHIHPTHAGVTSGMSRKYINICGGGWYTCGYEQSGCTAAVEPRGSRRPDEVGAQ